MKYLITENETSDKCKVNAIKCGENSSYRLEGHENFNYVIQWLTVENLKLNN